MSKSVNEQDWINKKVSDGYFGFNVASLHEIYNEKDLDKLKEFFNNINEDSGVYIRSLATRGSKGGLARNINMIADVLELAGFDIIIFETVGVGQVELDVVELVDTVVVVLVPLHFHGNHFWLTIASALARACVGVRTFAARGRGCGRTRAGNTTKDSGTCISLL